MNINITPGVVRISDPYFGEFRFDGIGLAQLENTATAALDNPDPSSLLNCLDVLIPGAWAYYDRRPQKEQQKLFREMKDTFSRICRALVAGNLYPLIFLLELAHSVRLWNEQEEQERLRE